jgi:3-hydroxyacyl-[acyl-carrier-protein] dehydratase
MSAPFTSVPLAIAPDHPAFAGHFPGHPIVPGALLLDEAVLCLARAEGLPPGLVDVSVAKFQRPVQPGDALSLHYRLSGPGRYALEVRALHLQQAAAGAAPGAGSGLDTGAASTGASGDVAATATVSVRGAPALEPQYKEQG